MMKLATKITKVQKLIKSLHTEAEYTQIIDKMKAKSGNDIEVLAYMADDKLLCPHERLCAVAAMGA